VGPGRPVQSRLPSAANSTGTWRPSRGRSPGDAVIAERVVTESMACAHQGHLFISHMIDGWESLMSLVTACYRHWRSTTMSAARSSSRATASSPLGLTDSFMTAAGTTPRPSNAPTRPTPGTAPKGFSLLADTVWTMCRKRRSPSSGTQPPAPLASLRSPVNSTIGRSAERSRADCDAADPCSTDVGRWPH
jgi:hypothetical protein